MLRDMGEGWWCERVEEGIKGKLEFLFCGDVEYSFLGILYFDFVIKILCRGFGFIFVLGNIFRDY